MAQIVENHGDESGILLYLYILITLTVNKPRVFPILYMLFPENQNSFAAGVKCEISKFQPA